MKLTRENNNIKNREVRKDNMNLQVEVSEKNLVHCFKVVGEIDAFTAPVLKERLESIQNIEKVQAEIDLSDVDYIDSTGLGIFIGFYKAIQKDGGYVKIIGVNARLERLFDITGINKIIDIETEKGVDSDDIV